MTRSFRREEAERWMFVLSRKASHSGKTDLAVFSELEKQPGRYESRMNQLSDRRANMRLARGRLANSRWPSAFALFRPFFALLGGVGQQAEGGVRGIAD